jgi:hypothetical protein
MSLRAFGRRFLKPFPFSDVLIVRVSSGLIVWFGFPLPWISTRTPTRSKRVIGNFIALNMAVV